MGGGTQCYFNTWPLSSAPPHNNLVPHTALTIPVLFGDSLFFMQDLDSDFICATLERCLKNVAEPTGADSCTPVNVKLLQFHCPHVGASWHSARNLMSSFTRSSLGDLLFLLDRRCTRSFDIVVTGWVRCCRGHDIPRERVAGLRLRRACLRRRWV